MNIRQLKPHFLFFVLLAAGLYLLAFRAGPVHATDAVVGTGTPQSCTEDAFTNALNSVEGGGVVVITFNCGGPATITFETSKIINNPAVTIDGGGSVILSGINKTRLFYVEDNAALELRNITLTNGFDNTYGGGAILSLGEFTLQNATIRDSNVDPGHSGGAIMSLGLVTLRNSLIENNTGGSAGGLFLLGEPADATIIDSTFSNNRTTNRSYGFGGAITTWDGADVILQSTTLKENRAEIGGAIYNESADSILLLEADSILSGNAAVSSGGGIFNIGGTLTVVEMVLSDNKIDIGNGGGMVNVGGTVTIAETTLINSYGELAGGIYNTGSMTITNMVLSGNHALECGGIYNTGSMTLTNAEVSGNRASYSGGGLCNRGTLIFTNGTISGNSVPVDAIAGGSGGAIWNHGGKAVFTHVTISGNEATTGGGIYNTAGPGTLFSLKNVILDQGRLVPNCAGSALVTSAGFNLASDTSCQLNQTGDHENVDPWLSPLANNGGFTRTHMLLSESPAIDAGQCVNGLATDQRGLPRLQGASCDIGALERQPDDDEGGYSLFLPVILK